MDIGDRGQQKVAALRSALRLSVREFAAELGASPRSVTSWEHGTARPRQDSQWLFETALGRAGALVAQRFEELLGRPQTVRHGAVAAEPDDGLDAWAEDLERAAVFVSHQRFGAPERFLDRPRDRVDTEPASLDLAARGWMLRGDVARDQGRLVGSQGAAVY